MPLTSDERVLYSRAVFSEFVRLHRSRIFSSAEFDLVRRWIDRGIPLPVVLRGIEECGGKPRTLHACEAAVSRAFSYWRNAAGLLTEAEEEWGPERAEAERKRIMAKFGRMA